MDTIPLTIDGKKITCPTGTSILDAAEKYGIKIPRLCHHPDLKPFGACRMCLVEDEKTGRLVAACVTPVAADMMIQTTSPRLVKHRRNIGDGKVLRTQQNRFSGGGLNLFCDLLANTLGVTRWPHDCWCIGYEALGNLLVTRPGAVVICQNVVNALFRQPVAIGRQIVLDNSGAGLSPPDMQIKPRHQLRLPSNVK